MKKKHGKSQFQCQNTTHRNTYTHTEIQTQIQQKPATINRITPLTNPVSRIANGLCYKTNEKSQASKKM